MRVWVTGVGIISPLSQGARGTMDRLLAGERAIAPLTLFTVANLRSDLAGEIRGLDVAELRASLSTSSKPWSRTDAMAVLAARDALRSADLQARSDELAAAELYVAGSTGGMFECEQVLAALKLDIEADVRTEMLSTHPLSAASDRVHEALGPFRRVTSLCSACSGGASAILLAADAIRRGRLQRAVAGGVDALCRLTYAGFTALGAVDPEPCRPFDVARAGLSLGEGAAFVVLESEDAARARGQEPIAELAGWSIASEAHHITHPEPSGATAADVMRRAIADAGLTPADIDYVNAHGTATPHNDPMETAAVRECFGERAAEVWVSSIKGAIGHTLGAAGAIEAAVSAMVVAEGAIPPTAGLETPDPACDLRHVRTTQRGPVRSVISNAFGFGGTDTALVFRPAAAEAKSREEVAPPHRVVVTGAACIGPLGFFAEGTLDGVLGYLEPGAPPADEPCELPSGVLEMMRARRLDRASRMVTIVTQAALGEAPGSDVAMVVGTAHGGVSATTHVIRRIFEKGAKYASPVHFPCVLPSALASHPSIYLGLHGPAFACSDLSASAEAAFLAAAEMVRGGMSRKVVAAAVDEHNAVASKISEPLTCDLPDRGARSEGASSLILEPHSAAADRALAEVVWEAVWRGDMPGVPAPTGRAIVLLSRGRDELIAGWERIPKFVVAERAGDHESVGGIALVCGVAKLVSGAVDEVLVVGHAPDRGYAWILRKS